MGYFNSSSDEKRNGLFASVGISLTLTWLTLSLRIWVRAKIIRGLGWDDFFLLMAAVVFSGYCILVVVIETIGGAQHTNDLSVEGLSILVNMVIASIDLYVVMMLFFKISLGIFYLRIVIRTWQRYVVYAAVVINTAYCTLSFFVALFNCGDPTKYLEHVLEGVCISNNANYIIQLTGCIITAATDWTFAILPIFVLVKATMPMPAKLSAGFVLLLACAGSVVSILRIQYIKGLAPGPEFFNTAAELCIWSIIEVGLGISAASAATLRPLFRDFMEQTRVVLSHTVSSNLSKSPPEPTIDIQMSSSPWPPHSQAAQSGDLESQSPGNSSHFSVWSFTQKKDSRGTSKLRRPCVTERTLKSSTSMLSPPAPPPPTAPVHPATPPAVPPKPIRTNFGDSARKKSTKMKATMTGSSSQPKPAAPVVCRQGSIRDRGISRPIPHIVSQISLAPDIGPGSAVYPHIVSQFSSPQMRMLHDRTASPSPLISSNHRRHGSPDWTNVRNAR